MDDPRIQLYKTTFEKDYNEKILLLRYKEFGKWGPRNTILNNIKKRYQKKISEPQIVEFKRQIETSMYNLTEICKTYQKQILYELYLKFPEEHNINDHLLSFNIVIGHRTLVSITNHGSKIFCTSHRNVVKNKGFVYYPIYLFECLEKGYLDTSDIQDNDIFLVLDYTKRNNRVPTIGLEKISLFSVAVGYPEDLVIDRNYVEYCLQERNSFYSRDPASKEWFRIISGHKESIQMPGTYITSSYSAEITTREKWVCPVMYISFLWQNEEQKWPSVRTMEVWIDDFKIPYASSRIITDNHHNFHTVWFFPDSDDDFIKDGRVFGINLSMVEKLTIRVNFDPLTNPSETSVVLGFLSFNVLMYHSNSCHLAF